MSPGRALVALIRDNGPLGTHGKWTWRGPAPDLLVEHVRATVAMKRSAVACKRPNMGYHGRLFVFPLYSVPD